MPPIASSGLPFPSVGDTDPFSGLTPDQQALWRQWARFNWMSNCDFLNGYRSAEVAFRIVQTWLYWRFNVNFPTPLPQGRPSFERSVWNQSSLSCVAGIETVIRTMREVVPQTFWMMWFEVQSDNPDLPGTDGFVFAGMITQGAWTGPDDVSQNMIDLATFAAFDMTGYAGKTLRVALCNYSQGQVELSVTAECSITEE